MGFRSELIVSQSFNENSKYFGNYPYIPFVLILIIISFFFRPEFMALSGIVLAEPVTVYSSSDIFVTMRIEPVSFDVIPGHQRLLWLVLG